MFKEKFSVHNKIWGCAKTIWELPRMTPRVCGPEQNRRQKVFHWEASCLCRGLDILKIYI